MKTFAGQACLCTIGGCTRCGAGCCKDCICPPSRNTSSSGTSVEVPDIRDMNIKIIETCPHCDKVIREY